MKKTLLSVACLLSMTFAQYSLITYDSVVTDLGNCVSLSGIEQVVTDSNGIYWFASANNGYSGLIAFDGTNWFEYSQNSIPPIGSKVNAISIDCNGDIWAAGREIIHFDGFQWKIFNINRSLNSYIFYNHWVTDIDFDSKGVGYFASEGVGSFQINDEGFKWHQHEGYQTYRANSDVEVVNDTAYFARRWDHFNGLRKIVKYREIAIRNILYASREKAKQKDTVALKKVLDLKTNEATNALVLVQRIDSTKIEIIEQRDGYWFHRDFYTVKDFNKIEVSVSGDVWVMADGYLKSKRDGYTLYITPGTTPGFTGEIDNFFVSSTGVIWLSMKNDLLIMASLYGTAIQSDVATNSDAFVVFQSGSNELQITTPVSGNYSIDLVGLNGQIIDCIHSGNLIAGNHLFSFAKFSVSSGMYIISIDGAAKGVTRLFLK